MIFWLNGEFKEAAHAINIADRGFLLGDGVFETILVVDGVAAFLSQHINRLKGALSALSMDAPIDESMGTIIYQLARRNDLAAGCAAVRLTVTRGAGKRGLLFPEGDAGPTILLTIQPYAPPPDQPPAKIIIGDYRRNEVSISSRYKTANYLDNMLARNDAAAKGCDEAIMLNSVGRLACASAANLFVLADEEILTPAVSEGALPGVVRGLLLAGVDRAPPVREGVIEQSALLQNELFLTNSLMGIRAAVLDGEPHGSSAPGVVVLQLRSWYEDQLQADLTKRAGKI